MDITIIGAQGAGKTVAANNIVDHYRGNIVPDGMAPGHICTDTSHENSGDLDRKLRISLARGVRAFIFDEGYTKPELRRVKRIVRIIRREGSPAFIAIYVMQSERYGK